MIKEISIPDIKADNLTIIEDLLEMGYSNKYHNDCNIIIGDQQGERWGKLIFYNPDETARKILEDFRRRGCNDYYDSGTNLNPGYYTVELTSEFIKLILNNEYKLQNCGSSSELERLSEKVDEIRESLRKLPPITMCIADLLSRVKKIEDYIQGDDNNDNDSPNKD